MKLELLISALKVDPDRLIAKMNISSNAVLINQCDEVGERTISLDNGNVVRVFACKERGVGTSRNRALAESQAEILLFSDDDIVYEAGYEEKVLNEFKAHPDADGIFFNIDVDESRRTYHIDAFGPVTFRASGRYPTYSLAVRKKAVEDKEIRFSTLFGGGARYSCGEDSLFIMDCIKAGLKLYKSPENIAKEELRESTWFNGYTEKFFFDRGVLYHFLYGKMATVLGARFILKHKAQMCTSVKASSAFSLLKKGIKEGKEVERKEGRI